MKLPSPAKCTNSPTCFQFLQPIFSLNRRPHRIHLYNRVHWTCEHNVNWKAFKHRNRVELNCPQRSKIQNVFIFFGKSFVCHRQHRAPQCVQLWRMLDAVEKTNENEVKENRSTLFVVQNCELRSLNWICDDFASQFNSCDYFIYLFIAVRQ